MAQPEDGAQAQNADLIEIDADQLYDPDNDADKEWVVKEIVPAPTGKNGKEREKTIWECTYVRPEHYQTFWEEYREHIYDTRADTVMHQGNLMDVWRVEWTPKYSYKQ